jgi:hypothetical protein
MMTMMRTTLKTNNDMAMTVHKLEAKLAQEQAQRRRLEAQLGVQKSTNAKLLTALLASRAELAKLRGVSKPDQPAA